MTTPTTARSGDNTPDFDFYTPPEQPRYPRTPPRAQEPRSTDDMYGISVIRALLSDVFGGALNNFAEKAWTDYNSGKPIDQILYELRQTDEYAARFPGMKSLTRSGRPISEAAYLDLERTYKQVARAFDLPTGFYDGPEDFGRMISGEVSPAEFQRRLTARQIAERESRDPVAAAEIARQFEAAGLGAPSDGDYLAALIDPGKGISAIEQRLEAARISTAAARSGYGPLTVEEGMGLADIGIDQERAARGFDALSESRELFDALPGEEGDVFGRQEQIGAAFGTDAGARRRIEQQRRRRQGTFESGGGVASGRGGLSALG